MRRNLVLFGTGKFAERLTSALRDCSAVSRPLAFMLRLLHYDVAYYVDNDVRKHGTTFMGRPVRSPDVLLTDPAAMILIATNSVNATAIEAQLSAMGLAERIASEQQLYDEAVEFLLQPLSVVPSRPPTVIFETLGAVGWAGVEQWSFRLARELNRRGVRTVVYCNPQQKVEAENLPCVRWIDTLAPDAIERIVDEMSAELPFIYFSNFWLGRLTTVVARRAKLKYGDSVRIVRVISADLDECYLAAYDDGNGKNWIDRWLCVSPLVRRTFTARYPDIDARRVFARDNFTEYDADLQRGYSVDGEPLRLCWVGRLVPLAKRADVLPLIVNRLRELRVNFTLDIAGDGELYDGLRDFVAKYKLANVVRLHGLLGKAEVSDVYRQSDVFLSFSDYEGSSMSQLEAMAHGCVPVLTTVSGTEGVVVDGVNGYVRPVGDFYGLIERICYLAEHRELLPLMGQRSRDVIRDKCTIEAYADFMQREVLNFDAEATQPCPR